MNTNIIIYNNDALSASKCLENCSINCIITSPPYFNCRNYHNNEKQIGLEDSPEKYIENLCDIFDSLKPKLKDDGILFVNIKILYGWFGHFDIRLKIWRSNFDKCRRI